ncbi:MAG: hypothetical protein ACYC4Q_11925 [Victivallaceae bacterium]
MFGNDILVFTLVVVSFLTWLVFVITACKFYKFFNEFEKYKSSNDVELNSLVWHAKKLDGSLAEIITEMRRSNKLLYEISIGKNEQPEVEAEFKTEDILRHNKMDVNKTPTGHTTIDMDAIVAHNASHKTAPPIAPAKGFGGDMTISEVMKNAAASVAAASIKSAPSSKPPESVATIHKAGNTNVNVNDSPLISKTPPPPAWMKNPQINLAGSVHNSANNPVPPAAHSPQPAGKVNMRTPVDLDLAHIPPPPADPACKISIDVLSSKSNQIDLKNLNESSNAVFVKGVKSDKTQ